MSELYRRATESYLRHYQRVNAKGVEPQRFRPGYAEGMQLMLGDLLASLEPGTQVLDLGCGTGVFLHWLSHQAHVVPVGVDSSLTQVQVAQNSLLNLEIVRARNENIQDSRD